MLKKHSETQKNNQKLEKNIQQLEKTRFFLIQTLFFDSNTQKTAALMQIDLGQCFI